MNIVELMGNDMYIFGLVLARISGFALTAPFISESYVPGRFRILGSLLVSIVVAGNLEVPDSVLSNAGFYWNWPLEFFVGAVVGMGMNLIFEALRSAGSQLGHLVGMRFQGGADSERVGLGEILFVFGAFLVVFGGGDRYMVQTFLDLYETVPVGALREGFITREPALQLGVSFFSAVIKLTLPIASVMILFYLLAGIFEHFFPNWDLFAMIFPGALLVGLWVLALLSPSMLNQAGLLWEESLMLVREVF